MSEFPCGQCGKILDPRGMFPGSTITCSCGRANTVLESQRRPSKASSGPYRQSTPPSSRSTHNEFEPAKRSRSCCRCSINVLEEKVVHEELVLRCEACRGLFVEHDGLAQLLRDALRTRESVHSIPGPSRPPTELAMGEFKRELRYLRCPHCASLMSRINFARRSGIMIDVCRAHGIWFDPGELDAVLVFVRLGNLSEEETQWFAGDRATREELAKGRERDAAMQVEAASMNSEIDTWLGLLKMFRHLF